MSGRNSCKLKRPAALPSAEAKSGGPRLSEPQRVLMRKRLRLQGKRDSVADALRLGEPRAAVNDRG